MQGCRKLSKKACYLDGESKQKHVVDVLFVCLLMSSVYFILNVECFDFPITLKFVIQIKQNLSTPGFEYNKYIVITLKS